MICPPTKKRKKEERGEKAFLSLSPSCVYIVQYSVRKAAPRCMVAMEWICFVALPPQLGPIDFFFWRHSENEMLPPLERTLLGGRGERGEGGEAFWRDRSREEDRKTQGGRERESK